MITVHHLENSRSQRVLWLLEELGLPYEVVRYERDPVTMLAPPELKKVHPLGKSPVISDGRITVAETGAIVEYLVDGPGEGRLKPAPGSAEHRRYVYWLHFAEGSAMPPLVMKLVFDQIRKAPVPFLIKPVVRGVADRVLDRFVQPNIAAQLRYMEDELENRPWFTGRSFSAADIMMSFPLEAAAAGAGLDERFPRLMDWLQRVHARPAYHRALQTGGPYRMVG